MPRPRVKAKTSEAMTSTIGGIWIVKKGSMFSNSETVEAPVFPMSLGNTHTLVPYESNPEKTVSQ